MSLRQTRIPCVSLRTAPPLLSAPSPALPPLRQCAGLVGVGPIYSIERGRFTGIICSARLRPTRQRNRILLCYEQSTRSPLKNWPVNGRR
jgi:hypothetical protein